MNLKKSLAKADIAAQLQECFRIAQEVEACASEGDDSETLQALAELDVQLGSFLECWERLQEELGQ